MIVMFLLMGYSIVMQLFFVFIFSLMKNNIVIKYGVCVGIVVGIVFVMYIMIIEIMFGMLFFVLL